MPDTKLKRSANKVPQELADRIKFHLDFLGVTVQTLAVRSELSYEKILAWKNRQSRYISRAEVARLAFAFADLYGTARPAPTSTNTHSAEQEFNLHAAPRYQGVEDIEHVLGEFLEAAGYRFASPGRDMVWHRLAGQRDRTLRIGWFEYQPFCYKAAGKEPDGISRNITKLTCDFLGVEPDWIELTLENATVALWTGAIDMLACQYVRIDPHVYDLWTSAPIPEVRVTPALLVDHAHLRTLERVFNQTTRAATSRAQTTKPLELELVHTATRVGRSLSRLSAPWGSDTSWGTLAVTHTPMEGGLEHIYKKLVVDIVNNPTPSRIRAFATDSVTAARAMKQHPSLRIWEPIKAAVKPLFDVCFALHPDEGAKLGKAINGAITRMREMDYFSAVLKSHPHWKRQLSDASALPTRKEYKEREKISKALLRIHRSTLDANNRD